MIENPFTQKDINNADQTIDIIVYTSGILENGKAFYAYLAIPPGKLQEFKIAEKNGNYSLKDFGSIITFGEEEKPSKQIIEFMSEKYGTHPNFEEIFNEKVNNAIKKSLFDKILKGESNKSN